LNDDDKSHTEREEDAIRAYLKSYADLVALATAAIAFNRGSGPLSEAIDGLTEPQAKALLLAKVGHDTRGNRAHAGRGSAGRRDDPALNRLGHPREMRASGSSPI
jgi:hypothetical protein